MNVSKCTVISFNRSFNIQFNFKINGMSINRVQVIRDL